MLGFVELALRYARFMATVIFSICVAVVVSSLLAYVAAHNGYDPGPVFNVSGLLTTGYVFLITWKMPAQSASRR